ncbi:MAG: 3-deoxy-D-manno-octulosonic acid transferase [Rhodobacteraceae bacterium]|nr:3-deoxy-D-manno-octulosonic acid transferase [Paracoccaceae bacterium]
MTALLRLYSGTTRLALPFVARTEARKLAESGMAERVPEKMGRASGARPDGRLLWLHAASVGESLSALPLIERFARDGQVLVTTGTTTSAELMAKRLPENAFHRFAALDAPGPVARFLDHWRPDACLFVESELWPNTIQAIAARGLPLALVNARISDKSLARWEKRWKSAEALLSQFKLILTQTDDLAAALRALGAPKARSAPNLKAMAKALPTDPDLMAMIPERAWVAASTHPGEEDLVLSAHGMLLERMPEATLLLAPRHPTRGDDVAELIARRGWPVRRRSKGEGPEGQVWLMDTLGELGSLYAAAPIVFLGGSLTKVGGHNPYEPAMAGAAVITGPHIHNFEGAFAEFFAHSAAQSVGRPNDLLEKVANLMANPPLLHARREAARKVVALQGDALDGIERDLREALAL